jgi:hypothetical protein
MTRKRKRLLRQSTTVKAAEKIIRRLIPYL